MAIFNRKTRRRRPKKRASAVLGRSSRAISSTRRRPTKSKTQRPTVKKLQVKSRRKPIRKNKPKISTRIKRRPTKKVTNKKRLRPSDLRQRHKIRRISFSIFYVLLVITTFFLTIYAFISLTQLPFMQVKNIEVQGLTSVSDEDVKKEVNNFIVGEYWPGISRANILVAPTNIIKKQIENKFPRFDSVVVSRSGLAELTVVVEERQVDALWCFNDKQIQDEDIEENENEKSVKKQDITAGECLTIDKNGYIFAKYPLRKDLMNQRGSVRIEGGEYFKENLPKIGENILPKEEYSRLQEISNQLSELKINITEWYLETNRFVDFKTEDGLVIRLTLDHDLEKDFANLVEYWRSYNMADNNKKNFGLEYIDLRFSDTNKVIIKPHVEPKEEK